MAERSRLELIEVDAHRLTDEEATLCLLPRSRTSPAVSLVGDTLAASDRQLAPGARTPGGQANWPHLGTL